MDVFIVWRWYIDEEPDIVVVADSEELARMHAGIAQERCKDAGPWQEDDVEDVEDVVFLLSAPDSNEDRTFGGRYFVSIEKRPLERTIKISTFKVNARPGDL